MNRILFVDSDENSLQDYERMLSSVRNQWSISLATTAEKAFEILDEGEPFGAVSTDINLPDMDGVEFLNKLKEAHPLAVRFLILQAENNPSVMKATSVAHQILGKPCDSHELLVLLSRALNLRSHIKDNPFKQKLHDIGGLPSLPRLYEEILDEIRSNDTSISRIASLIEQDLSISAKLLQIVNSAALGLRHKISNIQHACSLVGLGKLRYLVLMVEVFSFVKGKDLPRGFSIDKLWNHSLQVAEYAKRIASVEATAPEIVDHSFTAGMLHDLGLVILASAMPQELANAYKKATESSMRLMRAEKELFDTTHAEIGGYLLELWGLPDPIVEAIMFHEQPSSFPEENYPSNIPENQFTALTAVHVANYFCEDAESKESEDFNLAARGRSRIFGQA